MIRLKRNYQLDTDKIIEELGGEKPTLLLHSCCGPCSSYVLEYLSKFFEVTLLYYDPNIQPREEYEKRLMYQRKVLSLTGVKIMECEYDGESFDKIAGGCESEPEGGERCTRCFSLRLEETARRAAENGFAYYCTTLTVSPHKDCVRINKLGGELGKNYGVKWLFSDFKKRGGYQRSVALAKEMGLYRQEYCGCLFSASGIRER